MAAYNKFGSFTQYLSSQYINLSTTGHTLKVLLTSTSTGAAAPTSTWQKQSDLVGEVATGNGYSTGGSSAQITGLTQSSASATICLGPTAGVVFTASGAVGPFRYAILYDSGSTNLTWPLIAWYDYGSNVSLTAGETFTITWDASSGILQII
jgi:hypothetical protein